MKLKLFPAITTPVVASSAISCNNSTTSGDEQAIRTMYDQWKAAASSMDVEKMDFYAPSDTSGFYDAFPSRQYTGTNTYRDYENFLAAFPGPLKSDLSDGNMAYLYGIDTWTVTGQDNQPMRWRLDLPTCLRN